MDDGFFEEISVEFSRCESLTVKEQTAEIQTTNEDRTVKVENSDDEEVSIVFEKVKVKGHQEQVKREFTPERNRDKDGETWRNDWNSWRNDWNSRDHTPPRREMRRVESTVVGPFSLPRRQASPARSCMDVRPSRPPPDRYLNRESTLPPLSYPFHPHREQQQTARRAASDLRRRESSELESDYIGRMRRNEERSHSRSRSPFPANHGIHYAIPPSPLHSPPRSAYGQYYNNRHFKNERSRFSRKEDRDHRARETSPTGSERAVKREGEEEERELHVTRHKIRERSDPGPYNPFEGLVANVKKRLGCREDPMYIDRECTVRGVKGQPCRITVYSEQEKNHFQVVMLDPTYGQYPLEAVDVITNTSNYAPPKTYHFDFTPIMYGPHMVLLTTSDYFLVHNVRVGGDRPTPPRVNHHNRHRPRLPRLDVTGIPGGSKMFHAPRPRRNDEKFVDVRVVLENLLG